MTRSGAESLASQLGLSRLGEQLQGLVSAMADRGVSVVTDRLDGLTNKMSGSTGKTVKNMAKGDSAPKAALKAGVETVKDSGLKGASTIKDKVSEAVGGDNDGDKGKDKKLKFINIVEELDLPVPRAVAYQAWTQFEEFPSFMKKVENVEQQEDQTIEWKAQIFWSHRSWTAEIVDQVPNERIVWRSKGEKGHVDGAVTFHELTPDLTRMLVNLEYYPQGLFERTGNLWRAQGPPGAVGTQVFPALYHQRGPAAPRRSRGLARGDSRRRSNRGILRLEGSRLRGIPDSKDQDSERGPHPLQQPRALRRNRPPPQQHRAGLAQLRRSRHPASHRPAGLPSCEEVVIQRVIAKPAPSREEVVIQRVIAKPGSPGREEVVHSASSSRGTTAKKSTTSSSRSRS